MTATVEEVARKIAEKASTDQEVRFIKSMKVGQSVRQGDVYLTKIDTIPAGSVPSNSNKLVKGETKGSRHTVAGAKVYLLANPTPIKSVVVKADGRFSVEHPEHAHFSLPGGCYEVTQQTDFASKELKAVRD